MSKRDLEYIQKLVNAGKTQLAKEMAALWGVDVIILKSEDRDYNDEILHRRDEERLLKEIDRDVQDGLGFTEEHKPQKSTKKFLVKLRFWANCIDITHPVEYIEDAHDTYEAASLANKKYPQISEGTLSVEEYIDE